MLCSQLVGDAHPLAVRVHHPDTLTRSTINNASLMSLGTSIKYPLKSTVPCSIFDFRCFLHTHTQLSSGASTPATTITCCVVTLPLLGLVVGNVDTLPLSPTPATEKSACQRSPHGSCRLCMRQQGVQRRDIVVETRQDNYAKALWQSGMDGKALQGASEESFFNLTL